MRSGAFCRSALSLAVPLDGTESVVGFQTLELEDSDLAAASRRALASGEAGGRAREASGGPNAPAPTPRPAAWTWDGLEAALDAWIAAVLDRRDPEDWLVFLFGEPSAARIRAWGLSAKGTGGSARPSAGSVRAAGPPPPSPLGRGLVTGLGGLAGLAGSRFGAAPPPPPRPPPPAYSLPTSLAALGRRVRRNAPLATLPANYPWLLVFALLSAFLVWAPSALPGALGLGYAVGLTFKEARGATRAYWAWEAAERKRREDEARRDAERAQSEQEGGGRVAGEAQDGGTGALGRGQGAGASGRRPPESRGAETEGSASEGPSDPPPASLASPTAPRAPPPVLNAYYGRASPSDPRSLALFSGPGEELVPWRAIAACFGTYALLRGGEKLPAAVAGWFVAASAVALHLILRTEGWAGERAREGAGATNVRGDPAGSAKPTSSAASSGLPAADAPAPSSPSASSSFSLSAPFATRSPRVTAARPSAPAPVPPASDYIALSDLFELSSTPRRPDRFALFAEVDAAVRADLARRLERASGAADEWLAWARVRIRQWLDRKRLERAVLDAI